jgi:hypothetical protein
MHILPNSYTETSDTIVPRLRHTWSNELHSRQSFLLGLYDPLILTSSIQ